MAKFKKSGGDIAYDDDIMAILVEKYGYDEDTVKWAYEFLLKYFVKATKDEDRFSILLPNLGSFIFKAEAARNYVKGQAVLESRGYPMRETAKDRVERFKRKLKVFDKFYEENSKGKSIFTCHKYPSKLHSYYVRRGRTLEELEEYQNTAQYEQED